ncbi:MAG: hypothetical protein KDD59_10740 [Bdellovibrionales bacterium]|nr:hypothetical protein [Bdellovibrionales bacterium]
MGRTMFIVVSDDNKVISEAKELGARSESSVEVYSPEEWDRLLDSRPFVSQLKVMDSKESSGAKILPFPGARTRNYDNKKRVHTMNELESIAIENAIKEYNGNLTEAAKALSIGRATLYRKVKQYGIDTSRGRRKKAA